MAKAASQDPDEKPFKPLMGKQAAFVREFLIDGHPSKAAVRAGYAKPAAKATASRLLTNPRIALELKDRTANALDAVAEKTSVTKAEVVQMALAAVRGAREDRKWGAVRASIDLVARLHGYIIERRDTRVITALTDLTLEELKAIEAAAERDGPGRLT